MNAVPLVKGEIIFEEAAQPFTGAILYVRLEKIVAADAASEVIAEYVEPDVTFDPKKQNVIPFTIDVEAPDPQASYTVRVHIDVDRDGEVSQGDFINMQSYPVITFGYPKQVSILVRQVM